MERSLGNSVIYQLFLRPFTPEGTLKGAEKMLPHLKEMGIDIIYLCPVNESDGDMDWAYWSDRTRTCGFNNPYNPYRLKDYYKIDPEYGTEQDLADFVNAAHSLGLKVLLDLVYLHSGPKCNLMTEHPAFYKRNEDGTLAAAEFRFPAFDFDNPELREYFAQNMEYFLQKFDVDGYRCDCGGRLPADFWEMAISRARKIKPNIIMLCEGNKLSHLEAGFDIDYGFRNEPLRELIAGKIKASDFIDLFRSQEKPEGKYAWRGLENHDFANDAWENRIEKVAGAPLYECATVLFFLGDGVPFLYCGNEIADTTRHSILGNRFCAPNCRVNWSNALTPTGQTRMALIKKLSELRHSHAVLGGKSIEYLSHDCMDTVLAWRRKDETESLVVLGNLSDKKQTVHVDLTAQELLLDRGAEISEGCITLEPYGFLVVKEN